MNYCVPKLLVYRPQYLPDVFPKTQKTKLNEKQFSLNEMITRAKKCQIVLSFYKYIHSFLFHLLLAVLIFSFSIFEISLLT
jgi:hypothetical protein